MPIFHSQLSTVPSTTERIFREIGREALGAGNSNIHENVLVPGSRIPLHQHEVEEIIVCLAGTATCSFNGGAPQSYGAGSVLIIPPNTPHTIINTGSDLLRQIAFFPADRNTHWLEPPGSVA